MIQADAPSSRFSFSVNDDGILLLDSCPHRTLFLQGNDVLDFERNLPDGNIDTPDDEAQQIIATYFQNSDQATPEEMVIRIVDQRPGIKGTELVTEIAAAMYEKGDPGKHPIMVIEDLVKDRQIVEVEYVLPTMNYRIKSLYFPKGTEVKLNEPSKETG